MRVRRFYEECYFNDIPEVLVWVGKILEFCLRVKEEVVGRFNNFEAYSEEKVGVVSYYSDWLLEEVENALGVMRDSLPPDFLYFGDDRREVLANLKEDLVGKFKGFGGQGVDLAFMVEEFFDRNFF